MSKIVDSLILSSKKSTYTVELLKHKNGQSFVQIEQMTASAVSNIRLHPAVLKSMIETLKDYHLKIFNQRIPVDMVVEKQTSEVKELIRRYLNGVSIQDLTLQYEFSIKEIEDILVANDIEIVSNKLPKKQKRWRKYRRK